MANKKNTTPTAPHSAPLLMTAKTMSAYCGIGENTLRLLMDEGKLEYLRVGSHRLLSTPAIWAYYKAYKTPAQADQC